MWTEHVPDEANLDSKVFPRMIGLAEVLWSYRENPDYTEFSQRLEKHYPRLEKWGVNYGFEKIPIGFNTEIVESSIKVLVNKAEPNMVALVDYGDGKSVEWNSDSTFTTSQNLTFKASVNGREFPMEFPLDLAVHKGLGIDPSINAEYSSSYSAGGIGGLTDGILATLDLRDGRWQGFQLKESLEVVIDLGKTQSISSCSANFYQYNNAWIFAPTKVEYFISADGANYQSIGYAEPNSDPKEKGQFIETLALQFEEKMEARLVKMRVYSLGPCPVWHDAAGSDSWIFVDEFVIE